LLQQILFYRELDVPLEQIQAIVHSPNFDKIKALQEHYQNLIDKQKQLELLIKNVAKTIASQEGRITMSDKEKFEGFKQKMMEENEVKYGEEIRKKYGDDVVNESNEKMKNMTQSDYEEVSRLTEEVIQELIQAFKQGDPAGEKAQKAVQLHKKWLMYYWHEYNKEAHVGLANMYVEDERFKAYYDKYQPGLAVFLRDAIKIYANK